MRARFTACLACIGLTWLNRWMFKSTTDRSVLFQTTARCEEASIYWNLRHRSLSHHVVQGVLGYHCNPEDLLPARTSVANIRSAYSRNHTPSNSQCSFSVQLTDDASRSPRQTRACQIVGHCERSRQGGGAGRAVVKHRDEIEGFSRCLWYRE